MTEAARNLNDFRGTSSWCYRLMKRHGLEMRKKTRIVQKVPEDNDNRIMEFHKFITSARKETNYELDQIGHE